MVPLLTPVTYYARPMATVRKSMVAAVLAVHSGRLSPARAEEILNDGADDDGKLFRLKNEAGDQFGDDTVFLNLEQIAQRLEQGNNDLGDLVPDEPVRQSLVCIAANTDAAVMRNTLLELAPRPKSRDKVGSENPTQPGRGVTSNRPSTRVMELMGDSRQRYSVQREHARGGMGRILLARDNIVGREVALKELLPQKDGSRPAETEGSRGIAERFLREAKITGQLEHPNIVPVYEIGKHADESLYYTMKFVRGETLARKLARISRDPELNRKQKLAARLKLLDAFIDVCNAIAYAHNRGVIHRDLKPENVMVGEYGETVVLDWGLARIKGQEDTAAKELMASTKHMSKSLVGDTGGALTQHGSVVGTPAYMPPEQARGDLENVDEQSDVYALGAVLYEILTGRPPFDGPVPGLIIQQVLHGTPLRAGAVVPEAPPELEALIGKAMAREKADRMESARELANEIVAFRDGKSLSVYQYSARQLVARWVSRNKRTVVLGMIAAYVLVAAGAYHYFQLREEKRLVEDQKQQAETARASAELERENAQREKQRAEQSQQLAEKEEQAATRAKQAAEEATRKALEESRQKEVALTGWDRTLADAYAMRVRLAIEERDFNAALSFASAALASAEQPEARGALVSLPQVYPLIWELRPERDAEQQVYQFFNVAFSPDGTLVATGMPDGTCQVWDVTTGASVGVLGQPGAPVYAATFHPGGELLFTADDDGLVRIYDVDPVARRIAATARTLKCSSRVNVIAFRADGRVMACSGSRAIQMWELPSFSYLGALTEPDHAPMFIAFSPDGSEICSTCLEQRPNQQEVRVWDIATMTQKGRLAGHTLSAGFVCYSPDGKTLASGSLDSTIRLWDVEKQATRAVIAEHGSFVLGLAWSPDGRMLASCSADSTVRLWDAKTGAAIAVLSGFEGWVQSVAFSPDGNSLAARNAAGHVRVWRLSDRDRRTISDHTADVFDVRFSADGNWLLSASWDHTVRLRDARNFETSQVFRGHIAPIWGADISPDNQTIISVGVDGARVWDVATGTQRARIKPNELTVDVRISPDGKRFAISQWRRVHIYDIATLQELAVCTGHAELTTECCWSPDGLTIASASMDGSVRLWDPNTGQQTRVLVQGLGRVPSVTFRSDGKAIAIGGEDRIVRLINVADGELIAKFEGHEDAVFNVRFSPDGKMLFSSSADRSIRIWEIATTRTLAVLKSHRETVTRLAVNPQGNMLASGSQDDTMRIWPLWVLSMPREQVSDWAKLQTGLVVPEKAFAVRRLTTWPRDLRDDFDGHGLRREHVGMISKYAELVNAQYEGYRCDDITNPDGSRVRKYFPPRKRGADGRLIGPVQGRVNYPAWWDDRHVEQLKLKWGKAPVVTEILPEGQGRDLGLQVGDLFDQIDGQAVADFEALRARLEDLKDQPEIPVRIVRIKRDAKGELLPQMDEEGNLRIDARGKSLWDFEVIEVKLKPGKLGMRIGNATLPPRPTR